MFFFKDAECAAMFEYIGLAVVSYALLKLAWRFFNNIGTYYLGLGNVNLKKYGSWAIVTGCTDGIGKSYAELLAKRGLNIVLISRTLSKLEDQAKELEEKFSIHTKVITADFTEQSSIYSDIKKNIGDLDIAILVNNVGMGYAHPDFLENVLDKEDFVNNMINCNITSLTKMTAIVLPGMIKKKKGVIVNVASGSGRVPTPLLTVYSATKAYVDFFSRAANVEYASKGIIVQSLNPYFVSTKLSGMRPSLIAPKPSKFVADALNTLGSQQVTNGCLLHNIQGWITESIPEFLMDRINFGVLMKARAKCIARLKKKQEQAAKKE